MAEASADSARLLCSICLEDFTNPKLLPCFHTFCLLCLEGYVELGEQHDKFDCPLCRVCTAVPVGGVSKFQTNFYICPVQREENVVLICDICDNNEEATTKCLDCDENLCTSCEKCHRKMKISREHKLLELNSNGDRQRVKIRATYFCKDHTKEEIKMVCIDCDQNLCIVCKLTDHEHHTTKDLEKMAKTKREELKTAATKIDYDMKQVFTLISNVKQKLKNAEKLKYDNLRKLNEQTNAYVQRLKDTKEKLTEEIEKFYETDVHQLQVILADLEVSQANSKQLALMAENIGEMADDVALVSFGSQFKRRMDEVGKPDRDIEGNLRLQLRQLIIPEIPEITIGHFEGQMKEEENNETLKENEPAVAKQSSIADVFKRFLLATFPRDTNLLTDWMMEQQWPECARDLGIRNSDYINVFDPSFHQHKIDPWIVSINYAKFGEDFKDTNAHEAYANEMKVTLFLRIHEMINSFVVNNLDNRVIVSFKIKLFVYICSRAIVMYKDI